MYVLNRSALITGSGQGVGEGIARALASNGANVCLVGRTFSKVESVANEINKAGGSAIAIECDVKNNDSINSSIEATLSKFNALNILINNAQEVPLGNILDVTDESFRNGWDSGPLATFRFMKACYPYLKGDGKIINLASSSALRPDSNSYGAYAAVKESIRSLSRAAAVEWGQDNILVNCIMPLAKSAGMDWWMNEHPDEANEFLKTIPLGRVGDCKDDIGQAVCHILSDGMREVSTSQMGDAIISKLQ